MAGEMLKMARGAMLPTVAIGGQYNVWSDALNLRKGTWSNYYTISLSLSIPIFNGFDTQARIGQSKAAIRELDWTRKGLTERHRLRGPPGRRSTSPRPGRPCSPWRRTSNRPAKPSASRS